MSTAVTKTSPAAPPYAAQQQTASAPNPTEIAFQAGLGYIVSACLNVALKLRIPDRIGDGVVDVKILARQAGPMKTIFSDCCASWRANKS